MLAARLLRRAMRQACLIAALSAALVPTLAVYAGTAEGRSAEGRSAEEKDSAEGRQEKERPPLKVEEELTVTAAESREYAAAAASTLKADTPLLLTPQAVQVVRRGVLDDQRTLNLAEAIRNVAGTATDFGFNGSSQPLLILRGFPSTSMSATGAMSGAIGYYLDGTKVQGIPVSMANVDRVEVVKGPASVLYGRAEPGGLVNVVTRAPSGQRAFDFEQMAGTDGLLSTTLSATGALASDDRWIGRLAASYLDEGSDRDFVVNRNQAVDGDLAWRPAPETSLTFSAHFIDQRYRNDYGVPAIGDRPADLPRSRQFNDAPELSRIRATTGRVEIDHGFSPGWRLSARALALASDTREVDVIPYRLDLATFEDCLATRNELCRYYFSARPDGEYALWQVNADLIGDVEIAGRRHQIVFGADTYSASKEGITYLAAVSPVSLDQPLLGQTPRLDPALAVAEDRLDKNRWTSVYLQDQLELGEDFYLVAALRWDRTSAVYALRGTAPNEDSFLTPRLGLIRRVGEHQSVYAQYQRAISANNGRDPLTLEELDAEQAEQIEIGHKLEAWGGRFIVTTSAYQLTKENLADYSLYPRIQTVGEARSRGLELDASGRLSGRLSVIGSYAYTEAEVTEDPRFAGKRLANAPRHSGSLWLRVELGSAWAAAAGLFAQDQRQGDQANTFQLPGYARVDAMVSRELRLGGVAATLQINLENAFDRRYYTGSHQFVQDWIQPGRSRNASASLRLHF